MNVFKEKPENSIYDLTTKKHIYILYVALFLLYTLLTILSKFYIFNDAFYINSLQEKLSKNSITNFIELNKSFTNFSFLIIAITIYIKFYLVGACIYSFFLAYSIAIDFNKILYLVMISEFASILKSIFTLSYFLIYPPEAIISVGNFSPLGITFFFQNLNIPYYLTYLIQSINLFEIIYILSLAKGIQFYLNNKFSEAFIIINKSYVLGLFIWILVVTFLIVQF